MVNVPAEVHAQLKQIAWQEQRTLHSIVLEALSKYLAWYAWTKASEKEVDKPDSL